MGLYAARGGRERNADLGSLRAQLGHTDALVSWGAVRGSEKLISAVGVVAIAYFARILVSIFEFF